METRPLPTPVRWYYIYCYIAGALHFVVLAVLIWFILYVDRLGYETYVADIIRTTCWAFAPVALIFGILILRLPNLKPSKNAYVVHVTNIVIGIGGVCLLPFCLWLLVAWLQPDVRAYFYEAPSE